MRVVVACLAVIAAAGAALFFADRPGSVTLVWQGWQIETSVGVLAFAVAVVALLTWVVLGALTRLANAPHRIARRRRETHKLQGYRAITDGLVAIAAGDVRAADRLRLRADRHFLKGRHEAPPLSRLLAAQAALLRGDNPAAQSEFTAMLDSPETEFLGLRGLIVQAMKAGDDATALRLTERANRLRPATAWVLQSQLALETRAGEWRRAQDTLGLALKRKAITAEQGKRHRVALLLARAEQAERAGWSRDALKHSAEAHALDPAFAPAAVKYATLLGERERVGRGMKAIETSWARASHPSLAAAYDGLLTPEVPMTRLTRFERLVQLRPADPESHIAAASVALSTGLWGEARRHLDAAGATGPGPWPRRLCHLMAELEEADGKDAAAAHRWLDRGRRAPLDPIWVCGACGAETPAWTPLCPSCQSFDSLAWRVADRSVARSEDGSGSGQPAALSILDLSHPLPGRAETAVAATAGADAESATRGSGA